MSSSDDESSSDGSDYDPLLEPGYDPLLDASNCELIQAETMAIVQETVEFMDNMRARARKIIKLSRGDRDDDNDDDNDSSDDDDDSTSSEEGFGYVDDPPDDELTPWVFVDRKTKIVTVYEDKDDIKQALVKAMEDDTGDGERFKGWDKANNMGDSEFHLKGPRKMFHTPREAYEYMTTNYPTDDYKWLLVYEDTNQ